VASQVDHAGAISSDRTVLVELFDDAMGDPRLVIHSPFGGRVNGLWGLALAGALRERTGVDIEVQSSDDGILFRFPAADADFPLDLVTAMTPAEARARILDELPNSAVFGAQFRQNAARALLLPGLGRGKRTPFWLQRLRAKDLLQVVRRFEDFPIVAETYRDCLQEVMDLPHLEAILQAIETGQIEVVAFESLTPSPVAQSLLWDFIAVYMYEWDAPKAERQLQTLAANRDLLQELLDDVDLADLLRPEAVAEIRGRLQHTTAAAQVRSLEELAYLFQNMGDLSSVEVAARCTVDPSPWLGRLAGENRVVLLPIPVAAPTKEQSGEDQTEQIAVRTDERWVAAEFVPEYSAAFRIPVARTAPHGGGWEHSPEEACRRILHRHLAQAGPVTIAAIRARYAFDAAWLAAELAALVGAGQLAQGSFTPGRSATNSGMSDIRSIRPSEAALPAADGTTSPATSQATSPLAPTEFVDRRVLEQMHRRTLTLLRSEVQPVPFAAYADFLATWQHVHPAHRLGGEGGLRRVLQQLRAAGIAGRVWERDVLPLRLDAYQPQVLASLCASGELVWIAAGAGDGRRLRLRFLFRGEGCAYLEPPPNDLTSFSAHAQSVHAFLKSEGAVFLADLQAALDLGEQEATAALWELAAAGLVTCDSLAPLRALLEYGTPAPPAERKPLSSLETDLAARLAQQRAQRSGQTGLAGGSVPSLRPTFGGAVSHLGHSELAAAKRRVAARLSQPLESGTRGGEEGRWALVHRFGVLGKSLTPAEVAARQARQLLARHGVVTHASLDDEVGAWDWPLIYAELQRLEMRGEVRRGYFVRGLPGMQFALPEAVEQLRAVAAPQGQADAPIVLLNACDPANLYGREGDVRTALGTPLTFSRIPSTWIALERGLPVLLLRDRGADMMTAADASAEQVRRALTAWVSHVAQFEYRTSAATWNGEPVQGSAGQPLLEAAGFYRDYTGMSWERGR
jgi:ATP-dependent Lhr-like helicase